VLSEGLHPPVGDLHLEDVVACIARAVAGRAYLLDGREVWVGGIPGQIMWDNARSNLAEMVTALVVSLATIGTAVTPYAGWEKGKIESWHGISQVECYSTMPGYTEGPASFTGHRYWGDHTSGAKLLGEDLLTPRPSGGRWRSTTPTACTGSWPPRRRVAGPPTPTSCGRPPPSS
jgi:hypothetical protein